jgi:hypothetical protein
VHTNSSSSRALCSNGRIKTKISKATPFGVPKATMIPVEINEQHDQQAIFCKANAGALVTPAHVGQQDMLGKTAAESVMPSALLLSPNANNPQKRVCTGRPRVGGASEQYASTSWSDRKPTRSSNKNHTRFFPQHSVTSKQPSSICCSVHLLTYISQHVQQ